MAKTQMPVVCFVVIILIKLLHVVEVRCSLGMRRSSEMFFRDEMYSTESPEMYSTGSPVISIVSLSELTSGVLIWPLTDPNAKRGRRHHLLINDTTKQSTDNKRMKPKFINGYAENGKIK